MIARLGYVQIEQGASSLPVPRLACRQKCVVFRVRTLNVIELDRRDTQITVGELIQTGNMSQKTRSSTRLIEDLVKGLVEPTEVLDIRLFSLFLYPCGLFDPAVCQFRNGMFQGQDFSNGAHLIDFSETIGVQPRYLRAAIGLHIHKPFLLQHPQRVTHRHSAGSESFCQMFLPERFARAECSGDNVGAELFCNFSGLSAAA